MPDQLSQVCGTHVQMYGSVGMCSRRAPFPLHTPGEGYTASPHTLSLDPCTCNTWTDSCGAQRWGVQTPHDARRQSPVCSAMEPVHMEWGNWQIPEVCREDASAEVHCTQAMTCLSVRHETPPSCDGARHPPRAAPVVLWGLPESSPEGKAIKHSPQHTMEAPGHGLTHNASVHLPEIPVAARPRPLLVTYMLVFIRVSIPSLQRLLP